MAVRAAPSSRIATKDLRCIANYAAVGMGEGYINGEE
jgi:hypothetical protein